MYSHGLLSRSVPVLYSHGLLSRSVPVMYSHGLLSRGVPVMYSHGLLSEVATLAVRPGRRHLVGRGVNSALSLLFTAAADR